MADKQNKNQPKGKKASKVTPDAAPSSKPGFDPKPVHVGGESIVDRLLPHVKKIAVFVGATLVVLVVVFFVVWLQDRKKEANTDELGDVLKVADEPVVVEPAPSPVAPPATDDKDKKNDTFPSYTARADGVLAAIAKHDTPLADPVFRGGLLLQAGKVDEAIAEYRKSENAQGTDGVLAREGLGIALETKAQAEKDPAAKTKGLEDALAAFKAMQPDDNGWRRGYALYHQGRILWQLGKHDEAKAALEKAKELGKDTVLSQLAEERLASLGAS
ncbi:MAG TPA: tetratricopeptide repeat protein [Kofleriaceae bacterium]|nr:tetratricopeptide repeat protein [Kofleriaceae bacterium]